MDALRGGTTLASEAYQAAAESGLPGAHNGAQDAFRHCVWQCLIAKSSGKADAKVIGNGHERAGTRRNPPQPQREAAMDLKNNAVGRQCADDPRDCAQSCKDKLNGGQLFGPGGVPMAPPTTSPPVPER